MAWPAKTRAELTPSVAADRVQFTFVDALANDLSGRQDYYVVRPSGASATTRTYRMPFELEVGKYYALTVQFTTSQDSPVGYTTKGVRVAADGSLRDFDGKPLAKIDLEGKPNYIEVVPGQGVLEGETIEPHVRVWSPSQGEVLLSEGAVRFEVVVDPWWLRANPDGTVTGLGSGHTQIVAIIDGIRSEPVDFQVYPRP